MGNLIIIMKFFFAAALLATSNAMEFDTIELDENANTTAPAANTTSSSDNTTTSSSTSNSTAPAANTTKAAGTTGNKTTKTAGGADFGTIALIVLGGGFFAYKHFSK